MTATQLPLALAQRHANQQLFSDHYLDITFPQRPEWKLLAHDARPVMGFHPGRPGKLQRTLVQQESPHLGYHKAHCCDALEVLENAINTNEVDYQ